MTQAHDPTTCPVMATAREMLGWLEDEVEESVTDLTDYDRGHFWRHVIEWAVLRVIDLRPELVMDAPGGLKSMSLEFPPEIPE